MKTNAFLTHRAKTLPEYEEDTGKWVEGFYVILTDCDKHKVHHRIYPGYAESDSGELYPDSYAVDEKTVSINTSIKDKNGKQIYTGDIVKYDGRRIHEVVFEDSFGNAEFGISFPERGEVWSFGHYVPGNMLEIIGNVWDNPDLAKEARDA